MFIKTRKTAGSSIEAALITHLGPRDWAATVSDVEPLRRRPWLTPNRTTWPIPAERDLKRLVAPFVPLPALRLRLHTPAADVRAILGESRWSSYTTFTVERDPWDRIISLWRWRTRSSPCSLDEYLDMIETGDDHGHRRYRVGAWSNWPLYAIGEDIAVDHVLRYEHIADDLLQLLRRLGITGPLELPRLKSATRSTSDIPQRLTQSQVDRIAAMHKREIDAFGFTPPTEAMT